jgi:hypothetical protein
VALHELLARLEEYQARNPYGTPLCDVADVVKIVRSEDLREWQTFPEYRDHEGLTYLDYLAGAARMSELRNGVSNLSGAQKSLLKLQGAEDSAANRKKAARLRAELRAATDEQRRVLDELERSPFARPLLFISHRWHTETHPDPTGDQLRKLRALKNCFFIYDYCSFPQEPLDARGRTALAKILEKVDHLVENVIILDHPHYLQRGWCIFEYVTASLTGSVICDEVRDPGFVSLRNWAATRVPYNPSMHNGYESAMQNYVNEQTQKALFEVLPTYDGSGFAKESDRPLVAQLLVQTLKRVLRPRRRYIPYVGEWVGENWTEGELQSALREKVTIETDTSVYAKAFDPDVPSALEVAVQRGYQINHHEPAGGALDRLFRDP